MDGWISIYRYVRQDCNLLIHLRLRKRLKYTYRTVGADFDICTTMPFISLFPFVVIFRKRNRKCSLNEPQLRPLIGINVNNSRYASDKHVYFIDYQRRKCCTVGVPIIEKEWFLRHILSVIIFPFINEKTIIVSDDSFLSEAWYTPILGRFSFYTIQKAYTENYLETIASC